MTADNVYGFMGYGFVVMIVNFAKGMTSSILGPRLEYRGHYGRRWRYQARPPAVVWLSETVPLGTEGGENGTRAMIVVVVFFPNDSTYQPMVSRTSFSFLSDTRSYVEVLLDCSSGCRFNLYASCPWVRCRGPQATPPRTNRCTYIYRTMIRCIVRRKRTDKWRCENTETTILHVLYSAYTRLGETI